MIEFHYEIDFSIENSESYKEWLHRVLGSENREEGVITYIFVTDKYLLELNRKYLGHDE